MPNFFAAFEFLWAGQVVCHVITKKNSTGGSWRQPKGVRTSKLSSLIPSIIKLHQ